MTGLRRDEAASRANAPIVSLDSSRGIVKVNPLATWTDLDVEGYIKDRDLPVHPLAERGYPSIGCWPCTRPVGEGEDARAGRWAGLGQDGVRPARLSTAPADRARRVRAIMAACRSTKSPPPGSTRAPRSTSRPVRRYPPDAVAWLVEHLRDRRRARASPTSRPGTGKLTRLLTPTGATLVAVEPVAGMRATFAADVPGRSRWSPATAEQLPVRRRRRSTRSPSRRRSTGSTPTGRAHRVRRVLRPGGRLGLIWNARDRSNDLVDQLWSIMDRVEKRAPWRKHDAWSDSALVEQPDFTPLTEATFHHEQVLTHEQVARPLPVGEPHRGAAARRAGGGDRRVPPRARHAPARRRPGSTVAIPYRVDAYWCERR